MADDELHGEKGGHEMITIEKSLTAIDRKIISLESTLANGRALHIAEFSETQAYIAGARAMKAALLAEIDGARYADLKRRLSRIAIPEREAATK